MKNKNKRYFAEIMIDSDNRATVRMAKLLTGVNQHKNTWKRVNSRQLARKINNSDLVIK